MISAKCCARLLRGADYRRQFGCGARLIAPPVWWGLLRYAVPGRMHAVARTSTQCGGVLPGLPGWFAVFGMLVSLGHLACGVVPSTSPGRPLPATGHRYGPTTPGGYYVRVEPRTVTMSQNQNPQVTVAVENTGAQPVDDVLVTFTPSEGTLTTGSSRTRGGTVVGTFAAAPGSDSPRTAFLIVAVENVEVTVFIDIVPVVFGR